MRDRAEHRDVTDVESQVLQLCELEGRAQQPLDLEIRVDRGAAVQLGADLDRLARRAGRGGTGGAPPGPISKARGGPWGCQKGLKSRHPPRDVWTATHRAPRAIVALLLSA